MIKRNNVTARLSVDNCAGGFRDIFDQILIQPMNIKNKIFLIGNGFDIAHNFKTKFSDFAAFYLNKKIVPELINCIKTRRREHELFRSEYISIFASKYSNNSAQKPEDILWYLAQEENHQKTQRYIAENYSILNVLLKNSLFSRLYSGRDKNWFDIENIYFQELIPLKDQAITKPKLFDIKKVERLNAEFLEIKNAVKDYLGTLEILPNNEIENFFQLHCRGCHSAYFINFNYTSSVRNYITDSEKFVVNHIHGSLKKDDIIFGYGNDQNDHYQEMKDSEVEQFLEFFKTFDYLQNSSYDEIYENAIDKFEEYEVFIIGHSLGMTDKTLISEILNTEKCKKIYLFKRSDLKDKPELLRNEYRKLTYAASRIITDEKELRKKIVNFRNSSFFPN